MHKLLTGVLLLSLAVLTTAFQTTDPTPDARKGIKWYTLEEAMKLSEKQPKKIFIDVYTDWCGWCKRLDKTTFADPLVAAYVNEHFYPVKFNAEQKEQIKFKGYTMKFKPDAGRRGAHEFAIALLDGRMGYPAVVYLDEKQDRISISPGFKPADVMLTELKYIGGNHYKTMGYEEYKSKVKP